MSCVESVVEDEVVVDGSHGGRTFPDCRGEAPQRAGPDVPEREQADPAGLVRQWIAPEQVPGLTAVGRIEIAIDANEAVFVGGDPAGDPLRCQAQHR